MSLSGSLRDIGIIDLIQFPHQGRKTGLLTVRSGEGAALLYYQQGNLIHAENESLSGVEALVPLVDWKEASFVFDGEVACEQASITSDLHHTLLQVLKLRDERKNRAPEATDAREEAVHRLQVVLEQAFARYAWLHYAGVLGSDAEVVAEAAAAPDFQVSSFEPHRKAVIQFLRAYPGGRVSKIIIDHEGGLAMATTLPDKRLLMVVGEAAAMMGVVTTATGKLAAALAEAATPSA